MNNDSESYLISSHSEASLTTFSNLDALYLTERVEIELKMLLLDCNSCELWGSDYLANCRFLPDFGIKHRLAAFSKRGIFARF